VYISQKPNSISCVTGYGVAGQQPNYGYWVWKSGCSVSGFKKLNLLEKRTEGRWPIYDFGDMTLERGWKCLSGKPSRQRLEFRRIGGLGRERFFFGFFGEAAA
jgi:hypothetical protein